LHKNPDPTPESRSPLINIGVGKTINVVKDIGNDFMGVKIPCISATGSFNDRLYPFRVEGEKYFKKGVFPSDFITNEEAARKGVGILFNTHPPWEIPGIVIFMSDRKGFRMARGYLTFLEPCLPSWCHRISFASIRSEEK
jgi:hypothetical protein